MDADRRVRPASFRNSPHGAVHGDHQGERCACLGTGTADSSGAQLAAGQPHTYQVQIKNTSLAPTAYFVDPRLPSTTTLSLASLNGATVPVPLTGSSPLPLFLVPTHETHKHLTTSKQLSTTTPSCGPIRVA
jgi:hypothetical protein